MWSSNVAEVWAILVGLVMKGREKINYMYNVSLLGKAVGVTASSLQGSGGVKKTVPLELNK